MTVLLYGELANPIVHHLDIATAEDRSIARLADHFGRIHCNSARSTDHLRPMMANLVGCEDHPIAAVDDLELLSPVSCR